MKTENLSILKNNRLLWIDLSKKWAEVIELSDADANKLRARTHSFDIESKELVEIPQPEPEPIPEPTEEELKEAKIQEMEALLLRKQALTELWEATTDVDTKIGEVKNR